MPSRALTAALLLGLVSSAATAAPPFSFRNVSSNSVDKAKRPVCRHSKSSTATQLASPTPPEPVFINDAPAVRLKPSVPWTINTDRIENVIPIEPDAASQLYYGNSDPSESGHFAFVNYYFTYPSVNIDHADHVNVSYERDNGMTASFGSQDAFQRALESWSTRAGLVLIAQLASCGNNEGRCYFNATDLEIRHDERVIVATGELTHPDQITSMGETEWGWWNAESMKRSSTTSSEAAKMNGSSSSIDPFNQVDCKAPVDEVHDLPTACLGSDFDQLLDDQLGYTTSDAGDEQFLHGLMSGKYRNSGSFNTSIRLGADKDVVRRRSEDQPGFWSAAGAFFVKTALKATYNAATRATSIGGSMDRVFAFAVPNDSARRTGLTTARQVDNSPWGDAFLLKSLEWKGESTGGSSHMKAYCVGCSASGFATVAGRARWSPLGGLEAGRIKVRVNMHLDLKIGIEANAQLEKDFSADLFNYGLPALSYGVVTIGPYISLGARAGIEGSAKGKILAGAKMGLQDSVAVIDLLDSSRNAKSGWDPYVKPVFEADGEISLSAELGLPVGIKCGVKISGWEKAVGIIDEPSIKATARVSASAAFSDSEGFTGTIGSEDNCTGIATEIGYRNKVWVGRGDRSLDDPVVDSDDISLLQKCIGKSTNGSSKATPAAKMRRRAGVLRENTTGSRQSTHSVQQASYKLSDKMLVRRPTHLLTPDGSAKVVSCANGNIHVVRSSDSTDRDDATHTDSFCSGVWDTTPKSEVVWDHAQRSMRYYGNTMSKLGISRLRVSHPGRVPRSTVAVAFRPLDDPNGSRLYGAGDRYHQSLFPVSCDYRDKRAPKVFLVNDAKRGPERLRQKDLIYSVTGGEISQCQLLAMVVESRS